MSKNICDVCGTSYPETATQCPICGCVRSADAQGIVTGEQKEMEKTYTYVKGGRFSKKNVRKRNMNRQSAATPTAVPVSSEDEPEKKGGKGLVITAIVLLLAIIAVVLYLAVRYFMPFFGVDLPAKETDAPSGVQQTESQEVTVPCDGVELDVYSVTFTTAGEARMLDVTLNPADTTEHVDFTSDNEAVAAVNEEGKITAVAPGKAVITATCGMYSATCSVECDFAEPTEETTEASEETTEATTDVDSEFKLNRKDITFNRKDDTWVIYDGNMDVSKITWSSDNEKVATIEKGKVTAVGSGMTEVHAEYNGEKVSCIIRCAFSDNSVVNGSGGGVSEDGGGVSEDNGSSTAASGGFKLYNPHGNATDVTIKTGEAFTLQVVDASGNKVNGVEWSVSNQSCCSVSDGVVTGIAAGTATVSASYNGNTYSCIVRIG